MAITTTTKKPTASIAINRAQLKNYDNKFYLGWNQEFEVELYNPTTDQVLAEIEMNGQLMGSGIVLRPGERIFLDCVPDEDPAKRKKFKFETYTVDNNSESKEAIVKNGVIKIRFYNEIERIKQQLNDYITRERIIIKEVYPYYPHNPWYQPYWYPWMPTVYCGTSIGLSATGGSHTTLGASTSGNSGTYTSNSAGNANYCASNMSSKLDLSNVLKNDDTKLETGRIELSEETSKQNFQKITAEWQSYALHTLEFQLLPESRKAEFTIDKIRQYCPECRMRIRKQSWKFCPQCGSDLE